MPYLLASAPHDLTLRLLSICMIQTARRVL